MGRPLAAAGCWLMPGNDLTELRRHQGWSKWNVGNVRGRRNSAHNSTQKDQIMRSEIDDLPWTGNRLPGLRSSALDGGLTVNHFDVVVQERITFPVPVGSEWIPDMHRRKRSFLKTGDGIFDPHMTPVGTDRRFSPAKTTSLASIGCCGTSNTARARWSPTPPSRDPPSSRFGRNTSCSPRRCEDCYRWLGLANRSP